MDADQIARQIVTTWIRDDAPLSVKMSIGPRSAGELADYIAEDLQAAYAAGYAAAREQADSLYREMTGAESEEDVYLQAIRSMEPETTKEPPPAHGGPTGA